jgi:hypothetical protein
MEIPTLLSATSVLVAVMLISSFRQIAKLFKHPSYLRDAQWRGRNAKSSWAPSWRSGEALA